MARLSPTTPIYRIRTFYAGGGTWSIDTRSFSSLSAARKYAKSVADKGIKVRVCKITESFVDDEDNGDLVKDLKMARGVIDSLIKSQSKKAN